MQGSSVPGDLCSTQRLELLLPSASVPPSCEIAGLRKPSTSTSLPQATLLWQSPGIKHCRSSNSPSFHCKYPCPLLDPKKMQFEMQIQPQIPHTMGLVAIGVLWQDVTPSRCLRSRPVAFQGWWLCSGQLCKCWIISWSSCGSQAVSLAPSMSVLHVCTQRLQLDKGLSCLPQAFEFVTTLQHRVPCLKVQTYFLANRCWPLCSSHVRAGPAETEPFEETKNHISSAASGAPHMAKLQPWGPLAQNLRCFMGRSWCHVGWPPGRGWLIHPGPQLPVAVPTHLVVKESPVAPRAMAMVAPGSCLKLHLRLFSPRTEASLQAVLSRLLAE